MKGDPVLSLGQVLPVLFRLGGSFDLLPGNRGIDS